MTDMCASQLSKKFLASPPANHIGNDTLDIEAEDISRSPILSHNPARPNETIWAGAPTVAHVESAVQAARNALATGSVVARDAQATEGELGRCAYPVASMIETGNASITPPGISFDDARFTQSTNV